MNIDKVTQSIASAAMSKRPYNNLPFLVNIIKTKLQFDNKSFEEIIEITRRKQAITLESYDCQLQSQIVQSHLYELGIDSSIVLFEDETSQHVALSVNNTLYDCTFGCSVGAKFGEQNNIGHNQYMINSSQYLVNTVLKQSNHQKSDPRLQVSYEVISINEPAKEFFYYTSKNFATTNYLGTLWQYDDKGNMLVNLSISIATNKVMLSICVDDCFFEAEVEQLNMQSMEFAITLQTLCDRLNIEYSTVYNQLFYVKTNIATLKILKNLN